MNLFSNLDKFSSNTCVIDEDYKEFSYKDLILLSEFITLKIKSRSIVFLLCNNSYEFLASYIGLIRKKIVPFLVGKDIKESDLNKLIKLYKPQFIIKPYDVNFKNSFIEFKNINNNFQILKTNYKIYKIQKELALLLSTSGSTGSPRFVKISYSNVLDNTKKIAKFLKISVKDRAITTLQPNYVYGLSIINSHLIKGALIVMCKASLVEKRFWNTLKKTKVTTFGGVPYTYKILKKLKFEKMKLPHLKYITQAGGKLNSNLLNELILVSKKKKIKLVIMYGQTEATGRISYLDWSYIEKKRGSIGKPIQGGKFYFNNKNKLDDKKSNHGELVYAGKNVMLGYAIEKNDLNKNNYTQKLFTGDIARKDEDGFYYIEGRNSRFIKITGFRFNLDEIEEELRKKKVDCICTGKEDKLQIFLERKISHKRLTQLILKRFNIHRVYIHIYDKVEIPRNENGKVLYEQLNNRIN